MLGTALCDVLTEENDIVGMDVVRGKGHPSTSLGTGGSRVREFYEADITNPERVKDVVEKTVPDVIIHTAAWTDVDGCEADPGKAEAVNVYGTQNIVSAASEKDIPVIFISTDYVFDGEKSEPYKEDDRPSPLSVYGKTKYEGEKIVISGLARYVVVRTSWMYGSGGKNFVDTIINIAGNEKELTVACDQTGSPTYTKDLSSAIKELLMSGIMEGRHIFNISNSGQCSWFDLARTIVEIKGIKTKIESVSSDKIGRAAKRPTFSVLNNDKFAKITGHNMRPWRDALREYLEVRREARG